MTETHSSPPDRRRAEIARAIFFIAVTCSLLGITSGRNELWKDDLSLWRDAARKSPRNAIVFCNLGRAYLMVNQMEPAVENLKVAIQLDPRSAEAHYNLGVAYGTSHRFNDAIEQYQMALNTTPNYHKAHFNLGMAYMAMGRWDDARRELKIFLSLKPGSREAQAFIRYMDDSASGRTSARR